MNNQTQGKQALIAVASGSQHLFWYITILNVFEYRITRKLQKNWGYIYTVYLILNCSVFLKNRKLQHPSKLSSVMLLPRYNRTLKTLQLWNFHKHFQSPNYIKNVIFHWSGTTNL